VDLPGRNVYQLQSSYKPETDCDEGSQGEMESLIKGFLS